MKKITLIICGLLLAAWLPMLCSKAHAQSGATTPLDSVGSLIQAQDFADSKESSFIAFVLKEQQAHRAFLEGLIKLVLGFLAIIGGIAGFFFWRSFRDFKKDIKDELKARAQALVDTELEALRRGDILPLKQEVAFMQQFRQSHVLIVGKPGYSEELLRFLAPVLSHAGITRVAHTEWPSEMDWQQADLVAYLHPAGQAGGEGSRLTDLLAAMSSHRKPLVVYTHGQFPLAEAEKERLWGYQWFMLANMPLTLMHNLVSCARLFYRGRPMA